MRRQSSTTNDATREKKSNARESVRDLTLQVSVSEADKPVQSTSSASPITSRKSDASSDSDDLEVSAGFDFSLIEPLGKSVKEAIKWEESKEAPQKQMPTLLR